MSQNGTLAKVYGTGLISSSPWHHTLQHCLSPEACSSQPPHLSKYRHALIDDISWNCVTLSENSSKSFALWWTRAGLLVCTLEYPLLCAPTIVSGKWRWKNGCRSGKQAQATPRDGQDRII